MPVMNAVTMFVYADALVDFQLAELGLGAFGLDSAEYQTALINTWNLSSRLTGWQKTDRANKTTEDTATARALVSYHFYDQPFDTLTNRPEPSQHRPLS